MNFKTNSDVLDWYERQQRTLTSEFLQGIPWHTVRKYDFDERYVPVLFYMRDVETLTEMYHRELLRTPTGKDPQIRKFMERWGVEEMTHGEVLNRFLAELGYESDTNWKSQIRGAVSAAYTANAYLISTLTNLVGRGFTATHMTFGAIHEMETAQGYRRLMELSGHPVLKQILDAIIREESAHTQFYWSVARLELRKNEWGRKIARFVADHFWAPVGQGAVSKRRTEYLVSTLFGDRAGRQMVDRLTQRVRSLPGFDDIDTFVTTVERMTGRHPAAETAS